MCSFPSTFAGGKDGCASYEYSRSLTNKASNSKVEMGCPLGSGLHILAQFLVALKYTINHIIKATFLHVASDGYDTQFWPVNTSIRHVSHDL